MSAPTTTSRQACASAASGATGQRVLQCCSTWVMTQFQEGAALRGVCGQGSRGSSAAAAAAALPAAALAPPLPPPLHCRWPPRLLLACSWPPALPWLSPPPSHRGVVAISAKLREAPPALLFISASIALYFSHRGSTGARAKRADACLAAGLPPGLPFTAPGMHGGLSGVHIWLMELAVRSRAGVGFVGL